MKHEKSKAARRRKKEKLRAVQRALVSDAQAVTSFVESVSPYTGVVELRVNDRVIGTRARVSPGDIVSLRLYAREPAPEEPPGPAREDCLDPFTCCVHEP